MSEQHEHSDVLVPHSQRDMKRVALVIGSASIPMFVAAWRFYFLGSNDQEVHAAYAFAFGGLFMVASGVAIAIKTWRRA